MKKIKREVVFVVDDLGRAFLPRPSGWIAGWARSLWFFHHVGKKPKIASPDFWQELCEKHKKLRLVEFVSGEHQITSEDW